MEKIVCREEEMVGEGTQSLVLLVAVVPKVHACKTIAALLPFASGRYRVADYIPPNWTPGAGR